MRIARTGAGDKLCHGDRSLPQRFQTCTLLLVRGGRDCLHSPIGGSRRRLRACWRAPVDDSLPLPLAGTRCNPRRFQLPAPQALPQFIGQRIVEGLERQANCEERVVHRPDSILDRLEPLRDGRGHGSGTSGRDALDRLRQGTAQLFKGIAL